MGVEPGLGGAIKSVADGGPIDWQELDAAAVDDRARRRLRQLKLVAAIADVHSSLPNDDDEAYVVDLSPSDGARWGHLFLLNRIGEGAFGDVFHARDSWLDRD